MPSFFFPVIFSLVLAVCVVYIHISLIRSAAIKSPLRLMFYFVLYSAALIIPLSFIMRFNLIGTEILPYVFSMSYFSIGLITLLMFYLSVRDILKLAFSIYGKLTARMKSLRPLPFSADSLKFIRISGLLVIAFTVIQMFSGYINGALPAEVTAIDIPVKGLPDELRGFRIVQISDLHIEPGTPQRWTEEIAEAVNSLSPHVTVITGDIIDALPDYIRETVAPLSRIKSVYGNYAVTGNHEYYFNGAAWVEEFEAMGLAVLINSHRVIRHGGALITLAGVPDEKAEMFVKSHVCDPVKAFDGAPADSVKILLAHQPVSIKRAPAGLYDLQLSGHTHGGQYFPATILIHLFQPWVSGLYDVSGTRLYVNRGTGTWGPRMRTCGRGEISLIRLVKENGTL